MSLLVIHLAQVISKLDKNRVKLHDYFKISLISPDLNQKIGFYSPQLAALLKR